MAEHSHTSMPNSIHHQLLFNMVFKLALPINQSRKTRKEMGSDKMSAQHIVDFFMLPIYRDNSYLMRMFVESIHNDKIPYLESLLRALRLVKNNRNRNMELRYIHKFIGNALHRAKLNEQVSYTRLPLGTDYFPKRISQRPVQATPTKQRPSSAGTKREALFPPLTSRRQRTYAQQQFHLSNYVKQSGK